MKSVFLHVREDLKIGPAPNFPRPRPSNADISVNNRKGVIFNTGPYGDPSLKIKISKIGLRHVLSWPELGLAPKFHESGTFGGFGKREQSLSRIFNTGWTI